MIAYDLADWGHKISTACDGSKALEWLGQTGSDVTLLDLMLPRLDGWESVDRYRAITSGSAIPIIVASAAPNPELPLPSNGIMAWLPKPVHIKQLAATTTKVGKHAEPSS